MKKKYLLATSIVCVAVVFIAIWNPAHAEEEMNNIYNDSNGVKNVKTHLNDTTITGAVKDFNGHIYKTVKIGEQEWIAENLKATHFLNGDKINEARSLEEWSFYFLNKTPCYKKIGESFIYNGYVVSDERELITGNFSIPLKNDFLSLRKYLGKTFNQKMASYNWDEMIDPDNSLTIRGNNQSGFSAKTSPFIAALFTDGSIENQREAVYEGEEQIAWYWTNTKASCVECLGYKGGCLQSIMVGVTDAMTCDEPIEGPVNYAYGLQIRMIKKQPVEIDNKIKKEDMYEPKRQTYSIDDLVTLSKYQYGFVNSEGEINQFYGDFDCTSKEKYIFDFSVGCGTAGDIVSLLVKTNKEKENTFDLYIDKGGMFYGTQIKTERKVGELIMVSDNMIKGVLKLCLNKNDGCCGEEGEIFTLLKIK